jgi:hypothetical protein
MLQAPTPRTWAGGGIVIRIAALPTTAQLS